jgi:hypothetical protein
MTALGIAGAFYVWSMLTAFGVFGAPAHGAKSGGAAASAYQYQYDFLIKVTGSGSIQGPNGKVNFDLSVRNDSGVTSGSCTITEPKTKTKIKCLDVTLLDAAQPAGLPPLAVVRGSSTIDGAATTYKISVQDGGSPGAGNDTFSIETTSGYQRSGGLTDGNLQIQIQGL